MSNEISRSIYHFNEYMEASQASESSAISYISPVQVTNVNPEIKSKAIESIKKCLEATQGVSDEFLDWAHPHLKYHYRNHLSEGLRLILEGMQNDDVSKQLTGCIKRNKWIDFQNNNGEHLANKFKSIETNK